jgi:hypothetical protein
MITKEFKFKNGDVVTDKVTGFSGTITGSVYYLTGCSQYLVTAKQKDEFTEAATVWYDEDRLERISTPITEDDVQEITAAIDKHQTSKTK